MMRVERVPAVICLRGAAILLMALLVVPAHAHPLSQGALDVIVHSDRVAVRARITVEEVIITEMMTSMQANVPSEGVRRSLDESYPHHAGTGPVWPRPIERGVAVNEIAPAQRCGRLSGAADGGFVRSGLVRRTAFGTWE